MSKFYGTGKSNIKGILSIILIVGGFGVALLANQYAVRDHLIGYTAQSWPDRSYARVWFANDGSLSGAQTSPTGLTVERWDRAGRGSTRYAIPFGSAADPNGFQRQWAVDGESQRIAYVEGTAIVVRPLCTPGSQNCAGNTLRIPAAEPPLAFDFIPGRMLAIVLAGGAAEFWDSETGNRLGRASLDVDAPEQARIADDYVAVASPSKRILRLFRVAPGPSLNLVEESATPPGTFRLITPGTGQVAFLTPGGVFYRGKTRNTPGPVASLVLGENGLLVAAGTFKGIVVLSEQDKPYSLLEGETDPSSVVTLTASRSRFAYSAAKGTALVGLALEKRLTATGRSFNYIGVLLAGIGGLLGASAFLLDVVALGFKLKTGGKQAPKKAPEPPGDLIDRLAHSDVVLWAGAGLSAQCGFPTRSTFVIQLVQTAENETLIEPSRMNTYFDQIRKGQHEAVLEDLIATLSYDRKRLAEHYRVVYSRLAPLSPAHKAIRTLPITMAMTTNYDGCLETLGPQFASHVLTLHDCAHRGATEQDQFFLLKLFGDPRQPARLLLSHKEFAAQAAADPTLKDTFDRLLSLKTFLFLGCSVEGLVADLAALPIKKSWDHKHYALVGVSGSDWDKHVDTLARLYGIECLVCAAETIASEMPVFIGKLAAAVEEIKRDRVVHRGAKMEASVRRAAAAD